MIPSNFDYQAGGRFVNVLRTFLHGVWQPHICQIGHSDSDIGSTSLLVHLGDVDQFHVETSRSIDCQRDHYTGQLIRTLLPNVFLHSGYTHAYGFVWRLMCLLVLY
jgi:hypothetical protein